MMYAEDIENISIHERNRKWSLVLDFAFSKADSVAFNVLFEDEVFGMITRRFGNDLVGVFDEQHKFYQSGRVVKFRLSDEVKQWTYSKKFDEWTNTAFEDVSFWDGTSEIVATISHETMVVLRLSNEERMSFMMKGFALDIKVNE